MTATDIAKFAHATGETNPTHFDRGAAIAAGYADVVA
ncbi:MAG: MaoC family dehydratase N-terminal domain-containing protein, partial [Acidimicrobiia bacterium]